MKFCQSCGSFMMTTPYGYLCQNCGAEVETDTIVVKRERRSQAEPVYFKDSSKTTNPIVNQSCPRCDSTKAYRMILTTQGEHAGVKQDRSVEKYTCVGCGHTWTKS
jgi:DNA-directed RNA polymerase subunit M/transcription elongation factor TFIIS